MKLSVPRINISGSNPCGGFLSLIRMQALLLVFLASTICVQTANAEESLEELTKLYEENYGELLKLKSLRDSLPPNSDDRQDVIIKISDVQRFLDNLKFAVSEKGGNIKKIQERVRGGKTTVRIKVPSGGTIKAGLDDTETEFDAPDDYIPWKLDNWPKNTRRMHDKKFMIRLRVLEMTPTKWVRKFSRKFQARDRKTLKQNFLKIFQDMYADDEGKPWPLVLKESMEFSDLDIGEWVDKQAGIYASDKNFLNKVYYEVFDVMIPKSKASSWHWLEPDLHIAYAGREYEESQRNIRKLLLLKRKKWTVSEGIEWRANVNNQFEKMIRSEKKMLWLLGYSSKKKWVSLEKAEKYKSKILEKAQREYYRAYIRREYWIDIMKWYAQIPSSDPTKKHKNVLKRAETSREKRESEWKDKEIKLSKVKTYIIENSKGIVLKKGLERNLELNIFIPHVKNNSDLFYKKLLNEKDFGNFEKKGFFTSFSTTETYNKFLTNKRERDNFSQQNKLIRSSINR